VSDIDPVFASFEQKWLTANPEQAMVGLFVPSAVRLRAAAFGCLVHELSCAAYGIHEPEVAAAKLAWWAQELEVAATGHARHPVTHALFDAAAQSVDRSLWPALAVGALKQVEAAPSASLDELISHREPFYLAIADAESALFLDGAANIDVNAALWTLSSLLRSLPQMVDAEGPIPVPLDLLARHGLTRADLAAPGEKRGALIAEHLGALRLEIEGAHGVASVRTLAQRVRIRADLARIAYALRAEDALASVASSSSPGRLRSLYYAWSEARAITLGR